MNNLLFDQIKDKFQTGDFASAEKLCLSFIKLKIKILMLLKTALACMLQKNILKPSIFIMRLLI